MKSVFMGTKGVVASTKQHEPVLIPGQKSYPRAFAPVKVKKGSRKKVRDETFSPICNLIAAYPNSRFFPWTARANSSNHCRSDAAASNPLRLAQHLVEHVARDVCKPEVPSGITVGQPFVIETEAVQHRGVK